MIRQQPETPLLTLYAPTVLYVGLALIALAVLIVIPALLWDWWRRRDRRGPRCPRCWYNMSGVEGLRCPECGREAKSARQLLKSRRRWGWAVAAVAPLLLGCAAIYTRIKGLDPIASVVMPDKIVLKGAYDAGWWKPTTPWQQFCVRELNKRYGWRWPASIRKQALAIEGVATVPAKAEARAVWPSGSRVRVLVGGSTNGSYSPTLSGTRVSARFEPGGDWAFPPGTPDELDVTVPVLFDVGALPDGSYKLNVLLTLTDEGGAVLLTTPTTVSFNVKGELASVLAAKKDPATAAWLSDQLRGTVWVNRSSGFVEIPAIIEPDKHEVPPLAVRIERVGEGLKGGEPRTIAARGTEPAMLLQYRRSPGLMSGSASSTGVRLAGDLDALRTADLRSGEWWVVFEPDIETMLAEPDRTSYSAVSVRVPMNAQGQPRTKKTER